MRWLLRIGIGLVVVLLLALVGLAVTLPRLVESEEVRERIASATKEATGRDLEYAALDVGLLPPRLMVEKPVLSDPGGAEPVRAERISLRVALAPLLARTVLVDSVTLEGAQLHARRTKLGLEIPGLLDPGEEAPSASAPAPPAGEGAAPPAEEDGVAVAVRQLALRNARLSLEDRTVRPTVTWTLEQVNARATGIAADQPIPIRLEATLASGGKLSLEGTADQEGRFDATLALADLALAPLAPYAEGTELAGTAQLKVKAAGDAEKLDVLRLELDLDASELRSGDTVVRGRLPLRADLAGPTDALTGSFELDATRAEIAAGEAFQKPAGETLTAKGRLALAPSLLLDDVALRLGDGVQATARVSVDDATELRVDAPPFELAALAPFAPAAAEQEAGGRVALEGLVLVPEPLAVRGGVVLDGVSVPVGAERAALSGRLEGRGSRLDGRGLALVLGGQRFDVDVELRDLAGRQDLHLTLAGKDADSNALMAALTGRRDALEGPLGLHTDLRAPLGGDVSLLEALQGTVQFRITPGRLRGVSFLKTTFEQLGSVGDAALLAGRLKGGRTLQKFYGDEFDIFSATLRLGDGVARTNDLRLDYRHYRVELRGAVGLVDQALDMSGDLTIYEKIDEALSNQGQGADAGGQRGVKRVIPLAHVGGTLESPKVEITPEVAVRLASSYALSGENREKVSKEIDRALGEGSGEQVLDALEGLLGGGRRRSQEGQQ